jgi:hypothetical protein
MVYNSFTDMSTKLNSVITQANTTGIYVVALTAATQALASAAGESFNMPGCSLNIDAMKSALFNAVIPPAMLELYQDLNALNVAIQTLIDGGSITFNGMTLPLTVENVVSQLKNNALALLELNLPAGVMDLVQDPCGGIATMILNQLSLPINTEQVDVLALPKFRQLVHKIFENVQPGSVVSNPPTPQTPAPLSSRLGPEY